MQHLNAFGLYPMLSPSKHQCLGGLGVIALSASLAIALPTHAAILDDPLVWIDLDRMTEEHVPSNTIFQGLQSTEQYPASLVPLHWIPHFSQDDHPDVNLSDPSPVPLHQQEVPTDK